MTDHATTGYPTTFLGLFDEPEDGRPPIHKIEIPIIQRDFAQGRQDDETTTIRDRFLDAIVDTITSQVNMGLDFIYGDVEAGVLRPLDGQQRLTTLFLLHWYIASLAGNLESEAPWLNFSYATRPTARDFCIALAQHPYPVDAGAPSIWITDQPWYVYPWRQDPTIASMLVMLDAIHARLPPSSTDFNAVWSRLSRRMTDENGGAIWFLFLPVVDADLGEDLYIKMNSRGRPLTTFEVFKADFESIIKAVDPGRHKHLVDSMDGTWADTLWRYERRDGGDFKTDDEFERYLTFIIEISEWRDGDPDRKWHDKATQRMWPIEKRAALAFADDENQYAERNRDFFFHAFDTWVDTDPRAELEKLFTVTGAAQGPLPLFSGTSDLFGACISRYGTDFSAQETLLLFGVLLARQAGDALDSQTIGRRLRSLRNVTAAFLDRDRYMSEYVRSTEKLILDGKLDDLEGFRSDWIADEALKWTRMQAHSAITPHLHRLEDNSLIRGRVMAFDLDETNIASRAEAFTQVSQTRLRDLLGAALLAKGDYSRDVGWKGNKRQLGSSRKDDSWTDMLTTGSRAGLAGIREPLMALLDDYNSRSASDPSAAPDEVLDAVRSAWVAERRDQSYYDWRYYLARYAGARSSKGDGYYDGQYDAHAGGFRCGRLRLLHGSNYNAYFSDALLRAAWIEGELGAAAEEPSWWHRNDPGLTLDKSRIEIRCLDDGFELVLPSDNEEIAAQAMAGLGEFPGSSGNRVLIKQTPVDGALVDSEDRVQICIELVKHLHAADL
jgi:hypothetical protein